MDEAEKIAAAKKLHEKARFLRGRFLNHVAVIEREMAVILTEYFCREDKEKRDLFFEKVAERLPLQSKRNMIIDIVRSDYPDYWEENRKLITSLEAIQEFRNKLAHSVVDTSDEALARPLKEGVGFLQWKKGTCQFIAPSPLPVCSGTSCQHTASPVSEAAFEDDRRRGQMPRLSLSPSPFR